MIEPVHFSQKFKKSKTTRKFKAALKTKESVLLVTGPGGTGKSELLRYARKIMSGERIVVIAPTGIAALSIAGETFHSFTRKDVPFNAQDPFFKPKKFKTNLLKPVDCVLIDEASMLTGFDIDYLDRCLRHINRRQSKPFGAAKVVMFADYYQISPVIDDELKAFLKRERYRSPYSFHAKVFKEIELKHLELKKIHRQKDREFIKNLNRLRKGIKTETAIEYFNERCSGRSNFDQTPVVLCSYQKSVQAYNQVALSKHPSRKNVYNAIVNGDVNKTDVPVDLKIALTAGARVMAVKNSKKFGYWNGSLGTVIKCLSETVIVKFDHSETEVEIGRVAFDTLRYADRDNRLSKLSVGTVKQLPLRLGYAMTIHKAQGLSLNYVYVDFGGGAFANGQLYVALSRARTIEGLSLFNDIEAGDVKVNKKIGKMLNQLPTI